MSYGPCLRATYARAVHAVLAISASGCLTASNARDTICETLSQMIVECHLTLHIM